MKILNYFGFKLNKETRNFTVNEKDKEKVY